MIFSDGGFDQKILLKINLDGGISEKITIGSNEEVIWQTKYFWENGNIVKTEAYYRGSLGETLIL